MRYGLGYCGSKNGIAEWVCDYIPNSRNFYDLFAGGCAITHCSMLRKKSENYLINDISDVVELFYDAVMGKYKNETRWISREDFYKLKDNDPYIRYCWSFGNRGLEYMYSREVEPYKRACHYAIVFDDWKELEKLCPEIINEAKQALKGVSNIQQRRLNFGPSVVKKLKKIGDWNIVVNNPLYMSCHWRGGKLDGKQNDLQRLQSLESLESLERLQGLESLGSLERLTLSIGSYKDVKIEPDSVIYCDIPYRGTAEYIGGFNHDEFYSWCEKQTELVIISEYDMPRDRFVCIAEKEKPVMLSGGSSGKAIERLFIPKHQIDLYDSKKMDMEQLTLF